MLTKYFLEAVFYIIGQILTLITSLIPGWDYLETLTDAITNFMGLSTQVSNFFYFIFGDFLHIAVLMVGFLLPFKYIVVPLLMFIRKLFVFGGN